MDRTSGLMITSRANTQVKHVRRLQMDKRFRTTEQAFVVEGMRWMRELAAAGQPPRALYATERWAAGNEGMSLIETLGVPAVLVTEEVMAAMSDTETAPGVLAVLPTPDLHWPEAPDFLLVLDAVANPGNLGTILRAASAAGVDGVLLGPDSVDPYNPKVVRGSMGAVLRLPVLTADWDEIGRLSAGLDVWLAVAHDGMVYTGVDWRRPSALVIGSESIGAGEPAGRLATGRVTIPMRAETESLNAAVAAGILLFEVTRQRS
jgi:TrmH family RNA methyltransferase